MNPKSLPLLAGGLLAAAGAAHAALTVTVESFRDGNVPYGYVDVTGAVVQPGDALKVSEEPFLDYLIPNNSGTAGITAQKVGGSYISDSTVVDLPAGGANRLTNPDRYHVAFEWFDGTPLPFGSDYFGVSWGGWSANAVATLTTRIQFPDTAPVTIYHWFNDGWNYQNHDLLDGHELTVSLFDGVGTPMGQFFEVLPSGGAEDLFGDWRQFYTARIDVSGHAAGDILVIQNEGGNVGFKGTAVVRGAAPPPPGLEYVDGQWSADPRFGWLYGIGQGWFYSPVVGYLRDAYPWLYSPAAGWLCDYPAGTVASGLYLLSATNGPVYVREDLAGWFYIYAESRWARL